MNTLNYKCYYDSHYDFIGEKYSSLYPYLHKYPATMIPQIGIKLLNDYNISKDAKMLDHIVVVVLVLFLDFIMVYLILLDMI